MDGADPVLRRLADRIRQAGSTRLALDIRGTGTKRFYGNPPRGEPFEVGELTGIGSYEPAELVVTARAATPLRELEQELAVAGQCLPFEPPRFGSGGTVGGMVAAGLAGPARAKAGPLRDYVLGATLLSGTGECMTFGGQVMKNVAGYDLSRVFAGSLGTLGVICEVSLRVMPAAPSHITLRYELEQAEVLERLPRWMAQGAPLSASAWHRGCLTARFSGARAAVANVQRRFGGSELAPDAAAQWWDALRDQRHPFFTPADAQLERGERLWRLSVPDALPPLALPGDPLIEWGGALRWMRTAEPPERLRAIAHGLGGHATMMRASDKSAGAFQAPSAAVMALQRRLKAAFDPLGIFNPGRLYRDL